MTQWLPYSASCVTHSATTTLSSFKKLQHFLLSKNYNTFFFQKTTTLSSFKKLQHFLLSKNYNTFFFQKTTTLSSFKKLQHFLLSKNYNTFFFQKTTTLSSFKSNLKTFLFSFLLYPLKHKQWHCMKKILWNNSSIHYPSMSIPTFFIAKATIVLNDVCSLSHVLHCTCTQVSWSGD